MPDSESSSDESEPESSAIAAPTTEQQREAEEREDPELAALQKELDEMNVEQSNLFAPLAEEPTGATLSNDPTSRVAFSHSPYHLGKTQGLFSSGHVNESKSITELKLTMMSLENRLAILRASPKFDAHSADVERATLLVDQAERP